MKSILTGIVMLLCSSLSAQVIDTSGLTPDYKYGTAVKAIQILNNLILPRYGDTVSKEPGQVKLIGSSMYYTGKDRHWHAAGDGNGGAAVDTFLITTLKNRDKLKDTLLALINAVPVPTLSQVLTAGNGAPSNEINGLASISVNEVNTGNISSDNITNNQDITTNNLYLNGTLSGYVLNCTDINASGTVTASLFTGDGSGLFGVPFTESDPVYSAAAGGLLHKTDSTVYSTKANYKKGMDSLGAIIAIGSVDTAVISTKKWRQKGIDSLAGLIPSTAGFISKTDSTLYSTKANVSKARDSVVALIPMVTGLLSKTDSTLYSTKANYKKGIDSLGAIIAVGSVDTAVISTKKWRQKGVDSLVGLIPVVTGFLSKTDSTLYSTKANVSKARDSVVALIPSVSGLLSKTDSTLYSTKANYKKGMDSLGAIIAVGSVDTAVISTKKWRQKGLDSLVGLIPVVTGFISNNDSTLYSTKANVTKSKDSVVALIPSVSGLLSKSDSTLYSTKANVTKARDSVVALIPSVIGLLSKNDSTLYSTKANVSKARDSVVALIPNISGLLSKTDSTLYSTKANVSKARDSVVALIPSVSGLLSKSDSTLYSTKANVSKARDSVVALIPSVSGLLSKSDSTIYSSKANYKKGMDSLGALITGGSTDTTVISTKKWRQKGIDSVVALIPGNFSEVGTLYSDNYNRGSLGSNYTQVGSGTWSLSSNKLSIVGGGGGLAPSNYIYWNAYGTCNAESYTASYDFTAPTLSTTTYGVGFAFQSFGSYAGSKNSFQVGVNLTTTNTGVVTIYNNNTTPVAASSNGLTISTGDACNLQVRFIKNKIIVTLYNTTTGRTNTLDYAIYTSSAYGAVIQPNAFKVGILSLGGTGTTLIDNFSFVSNDISHPDIGFIGDSQTKGFSTDNGQSGFVEQLNANYKVYALPNAGPGNMIEDLNTAEILAIAPGKICILAGINNFQSGDNLATVETKYSTLVTTLTGAGYSVGTNLFLGTLLPQTSYTTNVTGFNTWLYATYSSSGILDYYTPLANGTGLRYTIDGIHTSNEGHKLQADVVAAKLGLKAKDNKVGNYIPVVYTGNGMVGITDATNRGATPLLPLDVMAANGQQLRLRYSSTQDGGGYLGSGNDASSVYIMGGMAYTIAGGYTAKSTTPEAIVGYQGNLYFYAQSGATAGSAVTPLQRMTITPTGAVGIGPAAPNSSALLDVNSTTKGFLPPRMNTAQKATFQTTAAAGSLVYDTNLNQMSYWNGTAWVNF